MAAVSAIVVSARAAVIMIVTSIVIRRIGTVIVVGVVARRINAMVVVGVMTRWIVALRNGGF